jgi:hypothetical protein
MVLRLCARGQEQFGRYHDRQVQRQRGHADGHAGMLPGRSAEDVDEHLREAVDDGRGLGVARLSLYKARDGAQAAIRSRSPTAPRTLASTDSAARRADSMACSAGTWSGTRPKGPAGDPSGSCGP